MATGGESYYHPNKTVTREHFIDATAGATTAYGQRRNFQSMLLKAAHATVVTAGTVTTHGYDIYNGTTSIASIVLGTNTAGVTVDSTVLNAVIAANDTMEVRSLADATGAAHVVLEYAPATASVRTK